MPISARFRTDFKGMRFGRLVVLKAVGLTNDEHLLVLCRCDCGNEKVFRWGHLNKAKLSTRSCGCLYNSKIKDLTGLRFGRLLVKSRVPKLGRGIQQWNCLCDCGNQVVAIGRNLYTGVKRSCGCLAREVSQRTVRGAIEANKKPYGIASMLRVIQGYKRGAKERGLTWELTIEQANKIFRSDCYYCGLGPSNLAGAKVDPNGLLRANGVFKYTGIDRIDNKLGYTVTNVVPSCAYCNTLKRDKSQKEFYASTHRYLQVCEAKMQRIIRRRDHCLAIMERLKEKGVAAVTTRSQ